MKAKGKIYLVMVVLLIATGGFGQISPGDLAQVHSHLEGISNCTLCHELGESVTNEKCLDCHKEIQTRITQDKGYHASSEIKGKACASCHNDHHGLKFEIIRFDKEQFDHKLTGYELLGAHKLKKCEDCHKNEFITDQKIKDKKFSYLGLNTDCLSCHDDYHQKSLSANCVDCHGMKKFKPAPKFDHNKTKFTLQGKHMDVACEKCHPIETVNNTKFQKFKGIEFRNCTSCHKDVHDNKFGQDCKKCHTENSFLNIKSLEGFDHSKTNFALEGKHVNLDCKKCHKTKYTDPIKHARCADCHQDYHEKQFVGQGKNPDCKDCHSVNSFVGSSYTIEKHNLGAFPLEGAHLATPCFVCHKKEDKWVFKPMGQRCVDCHTDIHADYITPKYYPENDCKACHSVTSWNKIQFDHKTTDFDLLGAHKNQTCRSCHFKGSTTQVRKQAFKGMATDCASCHLDTHAGQFEKEGKTDCSRCHINENWKPEKFNHDNTRFALDGRHKDVACYKCHKELVVNDKKVVQYKLEEFKCENCHH